MDRLRSVGVLLLSMQLLQAAIRAEDPRRDVSITPRDPASVGAGIQAAYRAGRKSIVVPAGVYRIAPAHERWHMEVSELSNFEIDARGATFLWQDRTKGGIHFHRCKDVRLRGATLEHEIVPFTQGTIVALDSAGKSIDVKIDAGYPADFDGPQFFPIRARGIHLRRRHAAVESGDPRCLRPEERTAGAGALPYPSGPCPDRRADRRGRPHGLPRQGRDRCSSR
jgi:hypothetical protein